MAERTRRRTGRRGDAHGPPAIEQPPFRLHRRSVEPTRVVSDDELEAVHEASLAILRDVGIGAAPVHVAGLAREYPGGVLGQHAAIGVHQDR